PPLHSRVCGRHPAVLRAPYVLLFQATARPDLRPGPAHRERMADASAGPIALASEVAVAPLEVSAPLGKVLASEPPAAPCDCEEGPVVEHPAPLPGKNPFNLSQNFVGRLGGAFSFMCTLTMEGIDSWTRVFDFSLQADEDSITAGAIDLTNHLHFTVFRGKKPISVRVDNFFELGKEFTMLCTVSDAGHMRVFKDGVLVGENPDGLAPLCMERPRMFVGGHFQYHNQSFRGSISGVKVWNREVLPEPAPAAAPACAEGGALGAEAAGGGCGGAHGREVAREAAREMVGSLRDASLIAGAQ
ncbi:unnamed protein product, partial [Prorocentrum cordatum]